MVAASAFVVGEVAEGDVAIRVAAADRGNTTGATTST